MQTTGQLDDTRFTAIQAAGLLAMCCLLAAFVASIASGGAVRSLASPHFTRIAQLDKIKVTSGPRLAGGALRLGSGASEAAGSSGSARTIDLTGSSAGAASSGSGAVTYRTQPVTGVGASGSGTRHSALVSRAAAAITIQPVAAGTRVPSAGTAAVVGAPATLQVPMPVVASAPVSALIPHASQTTTSTPTTDGSAGAGASEVSASIPAGRDGTWIVPPLPGVIIDGSQMPDVPGLATGPAPVGDLLALGPQGAPDAFDVTTRTWILTPPSSRYVPGMGYTSDGSKAVVVASASADSSSSTSSGSADTSSGGGSNLSAAVGADGRWIVAPQSMGADSSGNVLPELPGLAVGPAPAGDVLALGPADSEFAFDVTTRTWIMTPDSSTYAYRAGVGYVSTGPGS